METSQENKERNRFFSGIILATLAGVIGSLFISSFFMLVQILNYGFWNILLIFVDSGLGLVVLVFWMRNQIKLSHP